MYASLQDHLSASGRTSALVLGGSAADVLLFGIRICFGFSGRKKIDTDMQWPQELGVKTKKQHAAERTVRFFMCAWC